ncbi:MAG: alpha/beta fold hydrolase [Nitriliruptor sp.]|nr:MAG: alpha/beta fold hydrolase [Nitriliruptor sp.]
MVGWRAEVVRVWPMVPAVDGPTPLVARSGSSFDGWSRVVPTRPSCGPFTTRWRRGRLLGFSPSPPSRPAIPPWWLTDMTTHQLHPEARELERDGSRLTYWLQGPEDGPLIALTHGVSLDRHAFSGQVRVLVEAGYRVLTWDIRGHGRSQPMGPDISLAQIADDLIAILDDVPADRAVIAGQSLGGMVAQDLLDRYPDRVAAMVVIGAPALGDRPGRVMRVLQRLRVHMIRAWPDRLLRWVFTVMVTKDPEVRAYIAHATGQLDKRGFVAVSFAAMDGYLREERACSHEVPVLLVHGEQEERSVLESMHRWAARRPAVRHAVVAGGHLVNQENPEAFNQALLAFLAEHVPSGPLR